MLVLVATQRFDRAGVGCDPAVLVWLQTSVSTERVLVVTRLFDCLVLVVGCDSAVRWL